MTFFLFTLVLGRFFHRSGSGFFRIGSGFLADLDPDRDSEKKADPDPGKKPGSETQPAGLLNFGSTHNYPQQHS